MSKITFIEKNMKKVSKDERRAIEKGMKKLMEKILQYEMAGTRFEKIFNDSSVKYDVLGHDFYTFKAQTQKMPLRILYKFCRENNQDFSLEVHLSYQKKYDDKRYIGMFSEYAETH